jgi:RimJ/RimL family protein N-acetyltransferase
MSTEGLSVREMRLEEIGIRIGYFHGANDDHLRRMGVDRSRLPEEGAWRKDYAQELELPYEERSSACLVWEFENRVVGFSSADRITFGNEGFMHLHILDEEQRGQGLGARFVQLSAAEYFRVYRLQRLFCEPNAFNVAPNRTLQRAGFTYLFSHHCTPGPLNSPQITTRWVLSGSPPL